LHDAAEYGRLGAAKLLLDAGADPTKLDDCLCSPLSLAVKFDHTETATILLEKTVDVETEDIRGETVLHVAARNVNCPVAMQLLERSCDALRLSSNGISPFWMAVASSNTDIVELFLHHGFNGVNVPLNKAGSTSLDVAVQMGDLRMLNMLVDKGVVVDAVDCIGYTAMHNAAYHGHAEIIERLHDLGLDVNGAEKCKMSPLFLAVSQGYVCPLRAATVGIKGRHQQKSLRQMGSNSTAACDR
jgi:ankyrin repeat protein